MSDVLAPALSELARIAEGLRSESATLRTELEIRSAQARVRRQLDEVLRVMRELPPESKKRLGQAANQVKAEVEDIVSARLRALTAEEQAADLARTVDVTLPGRAAPLGHLHPITQARRDIERIFGELGFEVATGPQVETDFHNFEALAMPKDHPARDMQDTFYVTDDVVLRTHTSPVQVRVMLRQPPPVKIICPGVVYRRDDDPTHSPMFHQVEGLLVDTNVSLADLKGVLLHFVRRFFGADFSVRLRPSFFPFTEPSAEIDLLCVFCRGQGCRTCKSGWLEIGGSGMVDPEVFRHVGYDKYDVTGFAFGMGIDRMAMLRHGISDIKLLFENDVRFLRQF
ncbi:MAG TPA: phenylalanine--tRNA ligase subunit alpha [Polyangia bacterium]|nr:phenylalanine--tRNA ligase subunit alpha [Polyangia bacterium]